MFTNEENWSHLVLRVRRPAPSGRGHAVSPFAPRLLKGGLVQVDPDTGARAAGDRAPVQPRHADPDAAGAGERGEGGDRSQALRLQGRRRSRRSSSRPRSTPPTGSRTRTSNRDTVELGIHPQLAALEALVHPRADDLQANDALAGSGVLEVLPLEAPLTLFVWSKQRVVPVRVTDLSITEEAFDVALNPIRAKVSARPAGPLGRRPRLRPPRRHARSWRYLRTKESLAARAGSVALSDARSGGDLPMADPLQELLAAGAVPTTSLPADEPLRRGVAVDAWDPGAGEPRRCRSCAGGSARARTASRCSTRCGSSRATAATCSRRATSATPELWWRLADANGVVDPRELTDAVGRRLRVTLARGRPGERRDG